MKSQKGITLVALVITIIVMLILVGVSVTMAINGGLFNTAKNSVEQTQREADAENLLDKGIVTVSGEGEINDIVNHYAPTPTGE